MRNITLDKLLATVEINFGEDEVSRITNNFNDSDMALLEDHRIEMDENDLLQNIKKIRREGLMDLQLLTMDDIDLNSGHPVPVIYGIIGIPDPNHAPSIKFILSD